MSGRLNWMRLDNAAKIFPAIRRKNWSNVFRLSATLQEPVDPAILQQALAATLPRFPSMAVRLRKGLFWYYLEELPQVPAVEEERPYPLTHMSRRALRRCAFRVLYYKNRIAVELFHALTDGNGGLVFLKTLTAEYLTQKYGIRITPEHGVLDRTEPPRPQELEDSFPKYAGKTAISGSEANAYRLSGHREPDHYLNLITGSVDSAALKSLAHRYGVSVTSFLGAVMIQAVIEIQAARHPHARKKPVQLSIPINLRRLFPSETLRNFAICFYVGVDPRLGDYDLQEICTILQSQISICATQKQMAARIAYNVNAERQLALKVTPLFLKNLAMRMVYRSVGERKGCLNISNLGQTQLPPEMTPYVRRLEFIIGTQLSYPNNCSVLSYNGTTCINMIRSIREPVLERQFFRKLVELGLSVTIESNQR